MGSENPYEPPQDDPTPKRQKVARIIQTVVRAIFGISYLCAPVFLPQPKSPFNWMQIVVIAVLCVAAMELVAIGAMAFTWETGHRYEARMENHNIQQRPLFCTLITTLSTRG